LLCVIGDLVEDVVVRPAVSPARGTDTASIVQRARGGSAANVAAAAVESGCPSRFIGRVGDDAVGSSLVDDLAANGVDVRVQRGGRTGCIVVIVEPGGERTMLPDRGAAADLASVDPAWLDGVGWLHVPGYSLCAEPIGTSTLEAIERVRARHGRVSVDVSSVGAVEAFGRQRFVELLMAIAPELVLATADEAQLLGTWSPPLLVVKRGADPVLVLAAGGEAVDVPVPELDDVVDTTGAGDAFAGGFLAATLRGASRADAAVAGIALARRTLRTAGAGLAPG
jgi:sugar/nucleoside kinase (ribokinase family)